MNQIPNIEETHNTREVEEKKYPSHKELDMEKYRRIIEAGSFDSMFNYGFDVGRKTLHHQLQKAREDICRNHLEKLEDALSDPDLYGAISGMVHGLKEHLSHSEIDQAELERGLVTNNMKNK